MAVQLPLATSHLIGFSVALILYGFYAVLFGLALLACKRRPLAGGSFDIVRWALVTLFALSTLQIGLFVADIFSGFVHYRLAPGTNAYFEGENDHIEAAKNILLYITGVVGDALICWRLYVIWSRSVRIVIAPLVTLLGYAVSGTVVTYLKYKGGYDNDDSSPYAIMDGLSLCCAFCALITNLYTTAMIVARLWWAGRKVHLLVDDPSVERGQKNWYSNIMLAIAESGALYTLSIITTIIISCLIPGSDFIFGYIQPMMASIAPTMLVLQLHIARLIPHDPEDPSKSDSGAVSTAIRFRQINITKAESNTIPSLLSDACSTVETAEGPQRLDSWSVKHDVDIRLGRLDEV